MNIHEKLQIAKRLQKHANFFRGLWDISSIIWTQRKELTTAAVIFDKEGECLGMEINQEFWNELNDEEKDFVICHELSHFLCKHGKRFRNLMAESKEEMERVNCATDICINESLVRNWGFNRKNFQHKILKNTYWVDTVFIDDQGKPITTIPKNESSDYYLDMIKVEQKNGGAGGSGNGNPLGNSKAQPLDSHGEMAESSKELEGLANSMKEQLAEIYEQMEKQAKESGQHNPLIPEMRNAGTGGGAHFQIDVKKKEKSKWETVIRKWSRQTVREREASVMRWDLRERRFEDILSRGDLMIPSEVSLDNTTLHKGKIDVLFFLDTSGSCFHLAQRFFTAAASLPKKHFNVRLFCFDTQVFETTIESKKAYGGGGTAFGAVAAKVNQLQNEGLTPKSIWVITDGYFEGKFNVANPSIWHFFLTECHSKQLLPDGVKTFDLKDYE